MDSAQQHNRGPQFLAIFCTGTAFATVLVLLRFWIRARILRKVGLDDWFVVASLVWMTLSTIPRCLIHEEPNGQITGYTCMSR